MTKSRDAGGDPGSEMRSKASVGASLRKTMRELVASREPEDGIAGAKHRVRMFQNRRFAKTYADLSTQTRYQAAVKFFLDELYSDADTSARDADLERVLPMLINFAPVPALQTVRDALAFEALCERLDAEVGRALGNSRVTANTYGEAFRACGQSSLRRRQIQYVGRIGASLDTLTRWPMVGTTLRMMRGPASSAGLSVLQQFLERGFTAFRHMRGADDFLATIVQRETLIVERLYAAHPRPFDLEDAE